MAGKPVKPFTAIENSSIARASQIGLAVLGALVIIKSHLNQKTGQCNPSYATIAKEAGVDRSTIIRYVKKLKAVNLIDPHLRFREDGGYGANQYHFSAAGENPTTQQPVKPDKLEYVVEPVIEPHPIVAEQSAPYDTSASPPGGTDATPPGGNCATTPSGNIATSLMNKTKERTSEPLLCLPTEKQKTCPHPPEEIACLSENIIICNHCFTLLDENPTLTTITLPCSPDSALPECDPAERGNPEAKIPPVGNPSKIALETPVGMARKSCQSALDDEKSGSKRNPLGLIGTLLTGALRGLSGG